MEIQDQLEAGIRKGFLTTKKRIVFEGAIYHVTQRAPGKELIFLEDSDYLYFLKLLKTAAHKFFLKVYSFALMPNHVHLLFKTTRANLSGSMKNLFERYAEYFNKKYCRKGHVFCGRFRASLCNDATYFLTVSAYIHLNPLRSGLCDNVRDYKWSSIRLFLDKNAKTFVQYKNVLSIIDSNLDEARKNYSSLMLALLEKRSPNCGSSMKHLLSYGINITRRASVIPENTNTDEMVRLFDINNKRNPESLKARKYAIEQLLSEGYAYSEVQDKLSISKATFYRLIR